MENIVWDENYAVGITEIDEQHKKLVNLISVLNEAIYAGQGCEQLEKVFTELVEYTKIHFANEEELLTSNSYPDIEKHKEKHEELTKEVANFQSQFSDGMVFITMQVMEFLKDWLINHILDIDKKYAPFLKDKGVS